ncbi:hypothetical protein F4808DRAFT_184239 [Astrocystis sublimbata]|nr:hypothetical protein F4808DRAFT_184239 [Astrocystis sublimbata]
MTSFQSIPPFLLVVTPSEAPCLSISLSPSHTLSINHNHRSLVPGRISSHIASANPYHTHRLEAFFRWHPFLCILTGLAGLTRLGFHGRSTKTPLSSP